MSDQSFRSSLLQARICSIERGLEIVDSIKFIRVKSKGYNAYIMDQHMPVMGEIDGDVSFATERDEKELKKIRGFFCHQHNVFTLLISEHSV